VRDGGAIIERPEHTLKLERTGPPGMTRWRRYRRPHRRWALSALLAVVVGVPLIAGLRVWYIARQDDRPRSDAIIVLGAAQFNGAPGPVLEWRLEHALKLYREGVAHTVVTVGGNRPGDQFTEAGTGKRWLGQHGVPATRVVAVRSGSDTLQSMIAVGRVYKRHGWHSGVIVTDPWHALRSRTMARDHGIEAVTSPTRSGPTVGSRDTQFHYIFRETGGYLYYTLVRRWTS
jgi:vancomycin permeability regulator SanA